MSKYPPNPNSSAAKSRWSEEALTPIREEGHKHAEIIGRTVNDLPSTIPRLAKDVAKLTAIRCYQRQALPEVMAALDRLRTETNWDQPFLVCDADEAFDWRTAPLRRYAGFEDFYKRELEATWGKWADLSSAWADLVEGKISEEEFEELRKHGQRGKAKRPCITGSSVGERFTAAYIRARLKRDSHDEELPEPVRNHRAALLAKVTGGEMSAHAAAVEAGWRARMVQVSPTVEGFARAIRRHLDAADIPALKESL
jgi:hypothetical protein